MNLIPSISNRNSVDVRNLDVGRIQRQFINVSRKKEFMGMRLKNTKIWKSVFSSIIRITK